MMFADAGRLTRLCKLSHAACTALTPFVLSCYQSLNSETSKLKADKSFFTIADGTVQYLLVNHLFGGSKFAAIVGEEEDSNVQIRAAPYTVDSLVIPEAQQPLIDAARIALDELATRISPEEYKDLSIFIDPIDGTREFSTGLGEQCSICIGFSDNLGKPVAGLVYRPLTASPTYSMGAVSEGFVDDMLDMAAVPTPKGLLTSNGGVSPFLVELMAQLDYVRVPSGGAGNKMLMLLEGKGGAYIQDRGVSRWDTCGAQAALEAHGGLLCKLSSFASDRSLQSYTYLQSSENRDFEAGTAYITPYNCKKFDKKRLGNLEDFAPYSNICGLLALNRDAVEQLDAIFQAVQNAREKEGLSYD